MTILSPALLQGVWHPDSAAGGSGGSGGGGVTQVAVKVLNASRRLLEDPSQLFHEVATLSAISHPDIVRLYGVCVEPLTTGDCVKLVSRIFFPEGLPWVEALGALV